MTEAERFLYERLNLAKPGTVMTQAAEAKEDRRLPKSRNENDEPTASLYRHRISVKCASCRKSFRQAVSSPEDYVVCPRCGAERHLSEIETSLKEPIVCQIIRVIFFICGFFAAIVAAINVIDAICRGSVHNGTYLVGTLVDLAILFGVSFGIKKGSNWSRYLLLALGGIGLVCAFALKFNVWAFLLVVDFGIPGALLFLPGCNAWFSVKTMLRKSRESENGESCVG